MSSPTEILEKQFEESFKIPKTLLLLSGIKIDKRPWNKFIDHFFNYQLFYYNAIVLYIVIYGEIYAVVDCIQTGKPFLQMSLNLPCITNCFLGTTKVTFLYLNKDLLIELMHKLKEIHIDYNNEEDEWIKEGRVIVEESVKTLNWLFSAMTAISILVQITFCLIPGFIMAYSYSQTGELMIIYPFIMKYHFFEVYQSSWWLLIYIHQVLAGVVAVANLFGCDILFYGLCYFIDMHFRVLCLEFENTVSSSTIETKNKLAKAIRRHQQLIDLVEKTEQVFSKPTLCHIVCASFTICLSAFIITISNEMSIWCSYVTLLTMCLSQIALICYFPDILFRSSGFLSESVYKSLWYNADESAKKTKLLVMIRSQKECAISAWGFVDLNLMAFTRILSTSWSYFALLRTMYE